MLRLVFSCLFLFISINCIHNSIQCYICQYLLCCAIRSVRTLKDKDVAHIMQCLPYSRSSKPLKPQALLYLRVLINIVYVLCVWFLFHKPSIAKSHRIPEALSCPSECSGSVHKPLLTQQPTTSSIYGYSICY